MTWRPSISLGRLPRLRTLRLAGMVALLGLLALSTSSGKAETQMSQPQHVRNIVLVHGAWADGSSWNKIIPLLQQNGFHVTAVHLPFTTLAEDAATVRRALALQDGPAILVGHSYGGAVITEAGSDPNVAALVYVAAFAPDLGQSAGELNNQYPPPSGGKEIRPDANGFLQITDKGVAEDFAQDLTTPEKQIIAAIQGQVSGPNELGAKVTTAAWNLLYRGGPGPDDLAGVGEEIRSADACENDPYLVEPCTHALSPGPGCRIHRFGCGHTLRVRPH